MPLTARPGAHSMKELLLPLIVTRSHTIQLTGSKDFASEFCVTSIKPLRATAVASMTT